MGYLPDQEVSRTNALVDLGYVSVLDTPQTTKNTDNAKALLQSTDNCNKDIVFRRLSP